MSQLRTAESVTAAHPDKICDLVADTCADLIHERNPQAHTAIESTITARGLDVFGESSTPLPDNAEERLRRLLRDTCGYHGPDDGLDVDALPIRIHVTGQSPQIDRAVNADGTIENQGAGDQGIMVGYACADTALQDAYVPLEKLLADRLAERLDAYRRANPASGLRPDGKTLVGVLHDGTSTPRLHTILISSCHHPLVSLPRLDRTLRRGVIEPVLERWFPEGLSHNPRIVTNPGGEWTLGGPMADSGLSGRKLAVDQYGPGVPCGGGALSGKDLSKTDRSGAYMARMLARRLVTCGMAAEATVTLSYMIGRADPVSVGVEARAMLDGPLAARPDLDEHLRGSYDLRAGMIARQCDPGRPLSALSAYGHYGRPEVPGLGRVPWES